MTPWCTSLDGRGPHGNTRWLRYEYPTAQGGTGRSREKKDGSEQNPWTPLKLLSPSSPVEWVFIVWPIRKQLVFARSPLTLTWSKIQVLKTGKNERHLCMNYTSSPELAKAFCRRIRRYSKQVVGKSIRWPLGSWLPKGLTCSSTVSHLLPYPMTTWEKEGNIWSR